MVCYCSSFTAQTARVTDVMAVSVAVVGFMVSLRRVREMTASRSVNSKITTLAVTCVIMYFISVHMVNLISDPYLKGSSKTILYYTL